MSRVAIVSGGNKGIGLAIVRGLCQQFKGDVILTARDKNRGREAVELLKKEGLNPKFHLLDILDKENIETLKTFLQKEYGGLDILINNAGISFTGDDATQFAQQAEITMETNYTALLSVCDVLFPILKPGARVVHVSSNSGIRFLQECSPERRLDIIAGAVSIPDITLLMHEFVQDAKENKKDKGWAANAYGASKIGVNAITPWQQMQLDFMYQGKDVIVNSCSPGFVATDMTSHRGPLTPEEGAKTPLFLALLPPNEENIRGSYCYKQKPYAWKRGEYPIF